MTPKIERTPRTLLFNPFGLVAGAPALLLGIAAILLAALIASFSSCHFDGVLDFHGTAAGPPWTFLEEGILDWLCLAGVLLAIGRAVSGTSFRTIDLFGTQALARWPSVLVASLASIPAFHRWLSHMASVLRSGHGVPLQPFDSLISGAVTLVILALVCWMVALMYLSFSTSCNTRGGKSAGAFIGGLVVAEVLSKVATHGLAKLAGA